MFKKKLSKSYLKKKILILILTMVVGYTCIHFYASNELFSPLRTLFNNEQIQLIKKSIFPYKYISNLEDTISQKEELISQKEEIISQKEEIISQKEEIISQKEELISQNEEIIFLRKTLLDIPIKKISSVKLNKKIVLEKYKLIKGFYSGIFLPKSGSGYIDFHKDNLFVLSSRGILAFIENINNKTNFKQIRNNINDFIGFQQYTKNRKFSLKDLLIHNNKVYISFTHEIEQDCWNTSVIHGYLNYENIKFKTLFVSKECVHSIDNIDKEFNAHSSGGRIINFDKNHILLTVGEYTNRYLAQDTSSVNGKIIKINIENFKHSIISMGHRNPQGLYYDREQQIILETEHGPEGGDEINLLEVSKFNKEKYLNFGWAIVSKGEHYGGKILNNNKRYEKYPLYKSHYKYGFIEPLKSFVPSIGISQITKIGNNKYVFGSMKNKSIYFFDLDNNKKIINLKRLDVFERVRDLVFKNKKLYLFLENTSSIGIISFI